jgi:hypothetical protein
MSHKTAATVAHTIGIDTGKNTLHLIGLDDQGAIVLREKIARGRIAARLANVQALASSPLEPDCAGALACAGHSNNDFENPGLPSYQHFRPSMRR